MRRKEQEQRHVHDQRRVPVRVFRRGHVVAQIWDNPITGKLVRYSVTVHRLAYRDEEIWTTKSFDYNDMINLRRVALLARIWMWWRGDDLNRRRVRRK